MMKITTNIFLFIISILLLATSTNTYAACGANTRMWEADAGTTAWNTNNNWNPANRPNNTSENALIVSDWRVPDYPNSNLSLGCFEIASGSLTVTRNRRLTIVGDYFKNIHSNSLVVSGGITWEVIMQGTGNQDFSNVDEIPRLRINNANTVNITHSFSINNRFQIDAGSGIINIDTGLIINSTASNVTIPSSATVIVKSGATFRVDRNLTIAGVLKLEAGAKLEMGNGRTLSVSAGGLLQLDGSSGSIATINAISGTYNFNVLGDINLNYFNISRTGTAGMNVTGNIQAISNGDFHYIATGGRAITLGASSSLPASINNVGFFDEGAGGTQYNIRADAYTGSVITLSDYSGIGGSANESDPGNKLDWGDAAEPTLQITDASAAGIPAASISAGTANAHLATFSFSMTGVADTASDITSIGITLGGSNLASDIDNLKVMKDVNGNCTYDSGTDTQIGSTLYPAGSPAKDTLSLGAGVISVIDTTQKCIHILGDINATAQSGNTVSMKIAATGDVINSQGYDWSASGAPPKEAGQFTITGAATKVWNGGYSGGFANNNDWTTSGVPNSALNCQIGSGYSNCYFPNTTERACQNIILQDSGTLNWVNRTTIFSAYGSLTIGSGYTFTQATNGTLAMKGSSNQSINAQTNYPGNLLIANTGATVSLDTNWQVSGNLTISSGSFKITSGVNLTVLGNINITGGTLDIEPGATLTLANGRTLTVGASGTLELIGDAAQSASITSINTTSAYTVAINGTIKANYYSFSNLGVSGVTINSGATIDASNYLQNGSYTYPVSNSATLLTLNRKIPGDALDQMIFDSNGSGASATTAIRTNTTAGTLVITNYSGDRTGDAYSNDPTYLVSWGSPTNTLKLTQEATSPASVNQGQTYTMGRFGFEQTTPGAFNDTDLTSIRVTLTGTGDASDISSLKLYYDSSCSGSGGSLLGSATLTGSPAKATFSGLTGATVHAHATAPPKRCIYVTADIDSLATSGQTVGIEISSNTDVTNSEAYAFNGAAGPAVNLGTPSTIIGNTTVWTGNSSTAWNNAGNWSSGIPTSTLNCIINNATRDPIITGTATCKSLTNGNGIITMSGGSTLELYGSFENTGTFTQGTNTLRIRDNGSTPVAQTIKSTSTLTSLNFQKTAGGSATFPSGSLTITNQLSTGASNNFTLNLNSNSVVNLSGGLQVNGATVDVKQGAKLKIGNGQSISVNGGTFKTTGTNDAYPQSLSNKAKIQAISGTYGFSASSGTVSLTGFLIDNLNNNGLNFSGSVNISKIDGGQLRSLSTSYASMKAIQFNNSGSKPSLITNFGWQWDSVPANTQPYTVASSSGCGGASISFDGWFGNWYEDTPTFDTSTKVSNTSCNITLDGSASPVSLTAFIASGYDSAIELKWTTGHEFEHTGFNVYKSNSPDLGFVQINAKLIRNDLYSDSIHGNYVFHDLSAINGETYYYMLEDISVSGSRTWHGPIAATADSSQGPIPSPGAGDIFSENQSPGSTSNDDPSTNNPTPDQREIATNVQIISETSNAMRLKITVPMYSLSAGDQAGYSDLKIDGYSLTEVAGQARLPYRTVLVNVPKAKSASYQIVSELVSTSSPIKISPADRYIQSGNSIVAQHYIDANYYAQTSFTPLSTISLGEVTSSVGRTILPVNIMPIQYKPSSEEVNYYSEIIVDIFLDDKSDWTQTQLGSSIWTTEGGLKIAIEKKGIHLLEYNELVNSGVASPFVGANINDLKLYLKDTQLPIRIESTDSTFNAGDKIIFYSPAFTSIYSKYTHLLLLNDSGSNNGLRMVEESFDPTALSDSLESGFMTKLHFEENQRSYFKEPYSEDEDHNTWARFFTPALNTGDDFFTQDIDLTDLIQNGDVQVHALLKGSRLGNFNNFTHHVSLWINESETGASVTFPTENPYYAIFNVPAVNFSPGINKLQLQAKGTYIGSTDLVDIDYFKVIYKKDFSAIDNSIEANLYQYDLNSKFYGFDSANIIALDISNIENIKYMTDLDINNNGSDFEVRFNQKDSRKFILTENSHLNTVSSLSLINGSDLSSSNNKANVLYIGPRDLLDAISPLANFRANQGYSYAQVDIQDIYNEFNFGDPSPEAIKSFIEFAHKNWSTKPNFVTLLGDSTTDPKGELGSTPRNSIPLKLLKGRFYDYGSDNWFVSFTDSSIPSLAIGRIPGNLSHQIESYAYKVIAYEDGSASSSVNFNKQIQLIIDSDQDADIPEEFDIKADALKEKILSLTPSALITDTRRTVLSDSDTQTQIQNSFNEGRSIIHYLGHGAEDMWSNYNVFTNDEAKELINDNYPLVIAMNCLNSYFYFNDEEDKGLAEELVLNPNGGAIAFWGSTSLTSPASQSPYQDAFYESILKNSSTLGEIIKAAKIKAGVHGDKEVLNSWTLIGDPLLDIKIIKKQVQPIKSSASTSTGGGCSITNSNRPWQEGLFEYLALFLFFISLRSYLKRKSIL